MSDVRQGWAALVRLHLPAAGRSTTSSQPLYEDNVGWVAVRAGDSRLSCRDAEAQGLAMGLSAAQRVAASTLLVQVLCTGCCVTLRCTCCCRDLTHHSEADTGVESLGEYQLHDLVQVGRGAGLSGRGSRMW